MSSDFFSTEFRAFHRQEGIDRIILSLGKNVAYGIIIFGGDVAERLCNSKHYHVESNL
jgi:hypothetical protein